MSWERRKGRWYYYEAEKVGGRVVKRYVGGDSKPWVIAAATLDRIDSQRRQDDLRAIRENIGRALVDFDALTLDVERYGQAVKQTADAAIILGGYHRHKRGEWRKRRMRHIPDTANQTAGAVVAPDYRDLLDIDSLAGRLKQYIADRLAIAPKDTAAKRRILSEIQKVEAAAAGPSPTPLEALLAERVAIAYAHVQYAELMHQAAMEARCQIRHMHVFTSRIDVAERRYLAAIKALAQIRRLQLPSLSIALPGSTQVNVGQNQVNIGERQVILGDER